MSKLLFFILGALPHLGALPQINVNAIDDGTATNTANNMIDNSSMGLPIWIFVLLIVFIILLIVFFVVVFFVVFFVVFKKKNETNNVVMTSNSVSNLKETPNKADTYVPPMQANSGKTQMMSFANDSTVDNRVSTSLHDEKMMKSKQLYFILTDVNDANNRFIIKLKKEIILGRTQGDIIIPFDGAISGIHCRVDCKGDLVYLTDLKSGNGTVYDGKRVYEQVSIIPGKVLEIGRSKFLLTIEEK